MSAPHPDGLQGAQLVAAMARGEMSAHAAGKAAFVGDRQRRIAEALGTRHQLPGVRSAAQEAEIGQAMEFGVGGKGLHAKNSNCIFIQFTT